MNYICFCSHSDLDETVTDQETRLTAAEENIQGTMIQNLDLLN